ncbi:MAG: ArsR/SmtB family transcription factor [Halobacteriales archaeon]
MARLLPSTPDTSEVEESDPRVIGLDSEAADDLIDAMSSETARELLTSLHEEPATPSEVADQVDTSLQNAQYHIENLQEVGAIEVIDTVYSEKGREMNVYAPADKPLVVVAGGEEDRSGLRTALTTLLAGVGVLGVLGVVINAVTGNGLFGAPATTGGAESGGDGGGLSAMDVGTPTPQAAGGDLLSAPIDPTAPGVLFFVGGATVLLAGFVVWYLTA